MAEASVVVTTTPELLAAVAEPEIRIIEVRGRLTEVPAFRLQPGVTLFGDAGAASLVFQAGQDGVQLSADNTLLRLSLEASPECRAIWNDTSLRSLGRLSLAELTASGQVQILARDAVVDGQVEVAGLDIFAADARNRPDRPNDFGVDVEQGAFTLWNMQPDPKVVIGAELTGLSAGRPGAPVFGSGIFVSGHGSGGGRLCVSVLETEAVYSDGLIKPGTAGLITGGVFVVYGAYVDLVRNRKPVTTYGTNDMVLDNWGRVDRWIAEDKITSHGPSSIGFVNFGTVCELQVDATIETFGTGSRGYNVLAGTVTTTEMDRIVTHGDAAMGILLNQPVGRIVVRRGIETHGGVGETLVEGVIVELPATGLSLWSGGRAREIEIFGGLRTHTPGIEPIEVQGAVEALRISGGISAASGDPASS